MSCFEQSLIVCCGNPNRHSNPTNPLFSLKEHHKRISFALQGGEGVIL